MGPEVLAAVTRLSAAWDRQVGPSVRRALAAGLVLVAFAAAHVGRIGTPLARLAAALAIGGAIVALCVRAFVAARRRRDVRASVRRTIGNADPALGAATLRAIALVDGADGGRDVGSPELAAHHLARLLGRAPADRIEDRAAAVARGWAGAGIGLSLVAALAVAVEPFRIVEGFDVLAARDGVAPLPLAWLDEVETTARPPEYLHENERVIVPFSPTSLPRGTVIVVRGRPLRAGRSLVLTDGTSQVPFVADGSGGVVARWTLGDSMGLRVAARFGSVRIPQADVHEITSIPDETPKVKVEGAPKTVHLVDQPSVAIHYEASDDHGLREVALVLRAGMREERRVLSRPATDAKTDVGGYELGAADPFFRRTYVPVEVTVQARDNDVVSGPKWGRSAPIIVVPPQVGEPEALRYAALLAARDALTDLLADRMDQKAPGPREAKEHVGLEEEAQKRAIDAITTALATVRGGLRMDARMGAVARGQLRRLAKALDAEKRAVSAPAHKKLLEETERVLLAFDSAVRGLGFRDAQRVARRLADVADEAGDAAALAAAGTDPTAAAARLDAATLVLDGGGKQLLRLGELGLDLGEIVANGLRRIGRMRDAKDMPHAELAARDLAARLRRPDPSFSGGGGGVESGGRPSHGSAGPPSEADDEMARSGAELEELARDHAAQLEAVEEALKRAISPEEMRVLREEAKRHAEAIREAVRNLPQQPGERGSAAESAAEAREQAEAMAGALENGRPGDAIESGRASRRSLGEASRRGRRGDGIEEHVAREAERADEALERELAWAEQALESLRRRAQERARGELSRAGKAEQALAERAKNLARKGQQGDASMPEEMLNDLEDAAEEMRRAERELAEGRGEDGLAHQKNAQRLLEMARGERSERGEGEDEGADDRDGGERMAQRAEIPGKDRHKSPEDFRKRVLRGLGSSNDPALREAVKRYAEGLLK